MDMNIVSIQFKKAKDPQAPLYRSLARALEPLLKEGERLPAVRGLAAALRVNGSTVVAAYRLLEEKGLVYTRPGSGTYCLPKTLPPRGEEDEALLQDYAGMGAGRLAGGDAVIDLAGSSPTAETFPVAEFKQALGEVLDTDGGYAFSYGESEGYYPLRAILADFSRAQYRIACTPGEILITSGAQQALDLIAKALVRPGDTVLTEMPSYIGIRSVFPMHGAKLLGVPVERDGLDLGLAAWYAERYRPRLLYTMPVYQTPTGVCLSSEKRKKLLALAEEFDFYIVEDDLFSDLNLKGERLLPLKSEDTAGRVLYVKSFSKLLMPGVRTGYVVSPPALFEKLAAAKYATDISGSGFLQRALAVYFRNGCWGGNVRELNKVYRARLDETLRAVSGWRRFGVEAHDARGGFGLWLTLPANLSDREVYYLCREKQVLLAPGSAFYLSPTADYAHHLRLSFASTDRLGEGLRIVGDCLKAAVNRKDGHTIFI